MSVYTLTKSGWFSLLVASLLTFGTGGLTLYGANSAPQLQNIGNRRVEPEKQISFQVSASDADGNTLTYGVGTPPGGSFHVSPTGSDTNPGTRDQPFRTLERAKAAVRAQKAEGLPSGGLTVWIHGGIHERSAPLLLEAADSGLSAEQPIRWSGFSGSEARISGGKVIPASQFALVTSASPVWNRLDASAKGQVRQIDLKPILGITAASTQAQKDKAYGVLRRRGFGRYQEEHMPAMELFINGHPMRLGRWPDHDAHVPSQSITANSFTIYGAGSPNVGGTYILTNSSVPDQVTFTRQGLVDGKQYYLWGGRWTDAASGDFGWNFILSTTAGDTADGNPRWQSYGEVEPRFFYPRENEGASGWFSSRDPSQPQHGFVHTFEGTGRAPFKYAGDRPSRWTSAPDAWVDGFWSSEWAESHYPIVSINPSTKEITLPKEWNSNLGQNVFPEIKSHHPWYAYNLLEEITQPGEWYLDRVNGILYLWPPSGFSSSSEVIISMLEGALIDIRGASHIEVSGLSLEASRYQLIRAENGGNLKFHKLNLRNSGGSSAEIINCQQTVLSRSKVLDSGHSAIWVSGGNRNTLVPSGNVIEDCEIARYGRFQFSGIHAVMIEGCGVTFQHNHIHSSPDRAIGYGGNDHLIAYNDIHDVSRLCADAAAIYTGGWDTRGNVIKHNYIHHINSLLLGPHTHGVYVDDGGFASYSEGNVFYKIGGYAFHFSGGRENVAVNNVIVKCGTAIGVTTRAYGMPEEDGGKQIRTMLSHLIERSYQTGIWASKYPKCALIPNTFDAIVAGRDTWLLPREGVFERNIIWQSVRGWSYGKQNIKAYFTNGQNVETTNLPDTDPLFENEATLDLRLKSNSPAFTMPGFKPIPFGQIGIRPE